jgi:hypothetical protein
MQYRRMLRARDPANGQRPWVGQGKAKPTVIYIVINYQLISI